MGVTLLITTHNRAGLLRTSLERLAELTPPEEVLVVDDGGTDDTENVCRELGDRLPIRYVYHDNPGQTICSFARNVGLKLAQTELIVTSEPEIVFLNDVLAILTSHHNSDPNRLVSAGTIHFAQPGADWRTAPGEGFKTEVGWVATYTALYRRDWLIEVGGWDEDFPGAWGWDDTDLVTRLRLAGYGQLIATDAQLVHQWHPLGADVDNANDNYFMGKSFHRDQSDRSEVVANQGRAWGELRTKNS